MCVDSAAARDMLLFFGGSFEGVILLLHPVCYISDLSSGLVENILGNAVVAFVSKHWLERLALIQVVGRHKI